MSIIEIVILVISLVIGLPALVISLVDVTQAYKRLRRVLRLEKELKK
jgi:hypothetical protein